MVTDRRTNTEIADELYLSRKTVETHIRNVFHKLGVASGPGLVLSAAVRTTAPPG